MQLIHYKSVISFIIILLAIVFWWSNPFSLKQKLPNKIIYVKTTAVTAKPMPIFIQTVGTIETKQAVTINAQVTGILKKTYFQEGDDITAGQLLFEIEPNFIEANLQQAQAGLARDQAQLAVAKADVQRYTVLAKQEYVTRQQFEQIRATAKAEEAIVAADIALVRQAQIQLSYAKIYAPISGKTGNVTFRPGDLIIANSNMPLVKINRLDPILVNFGLPQKHLSEIKQYQQPKPLSVSIFDERNETELATGKLVFTDNNVSPQTGTVLFKAELPNSKQNLWPGQIVTVHLIVTVEPQALVIPADAIQNDQQGTFVYLAKQDKAQLQRITIARQMDNQAIIAQGLKSGDQVIEDIPPNLTEGSPIAKLH